MTVVGEAPSWLVGRQEPTIATEAVGDTALGEKCVKFCRAVGMTLYPWQEQLLLDMVRTEEDRLTSREVVVPLARQNGKGEVLVARELCGIFVLGEKTILHTAHFLDTALDAQKRLWEIVSESPFLMQGWARGVFPLVGEKWSPADPDAHAVPRVSKSNGKESILFPNGATVHFRTRTAKTGRGLSVEFLVLDECFDLPNQINSALESLTLAQPNAQRIYISSPVDRFEHLHGAVFSAKRWAGIDGAPGVLFREWSLPEDVDPFSFEAWAMANPSLVDEPRPGVQLVEMRNKASSARASSVMRDSFMVENLGVGNWVPRDGDDSDSEFMVDLDDWERAATAPPEFVDSCVGVGVSPDGGAAGVVSVQWLPGGRVFLSAAPLVEFDRALVAETVDEVVEATDPMGVVYDPFGAANTLESVMTSRGLGLQAVNGPMVAKGYSLLRTMAAEGKITHDGDPRWLEQWRSAQARGTKYVSFDRYASNVTLLDAASLALADLVEFMELTEAPEVKKKKRRVGSAAPVARPRRVEKVAF